MIRRNAGLGGKVIEIGSGTGINLFSFHRQGIANLLGIDYDTDAVDFARNLSEVIGYDINFQQGNIVDLHNIVWAGKSQSNFRRFSS